MSGLRAGGLALVVGGGHSVLGCSVTTERLIMPGEEFTGPDGIYAANDVIRPKWLCTHPDLTVTLKNGVQTNGWALMNIEWLRPIDGEDFSHERTEEYSHVYGL